MNRVRTHHQRYASVSISAALHLGVLLFLAFAGHLLSGHLFSGHSPEGGSAGTLHLSWVDSPTEPQAIGMVQTTVDFREQEAIAPQEIDPQEIDVELSDAALVEPELMESIQSVSDSGLSMLELNLPAPTAITAVGSAVGLAVERGSSEAPGDGGAAASGSRGTFFGHIVSGERIVFVLDCSGSMNTSSGVKRHASDIDRPLLRRELSRAERRALSRGGRRFGYLSRWERLVEELTSALRPLNGETEFSILLFSEGFTEFGGDMLVANSENKETAIDWIERFNAGNDTYPLPALQRALEHAPDVVYFLTDGDFDAAVIKHITWMNGQTDHPATIHTVGLGPLRDQFRLATLARYNGGKFVAGH